MTENTQFEGNHLKRLKPALEPEKVTVKINN